MIEKPKKQKCSISEEDVSNLLQRYTATTIVALLQEVEQSADLKLNWKELVKKTTTGISNAREYQMLWRHLAYHDVLEEKLEDGAEPMDDDSDLECELEAFPSVSYDASSEAAACVKVLIASGLPRNSSLPNSSTVEAPLTINIPNGLSCRADTESSQPSCSMRGMNITVPVVVQKNITLNDSSDMKAPVTGKKRRHWSEAEDQELLAAVEKFGPGNWANILREEFKGDRTANQLSQRYRTILKQRGSVNTGEKEKPTIPQLTEAQLATRSALFRALDGPKPNLTAASTSNPAMKSMPSTSNQIQNQSHKGSTATKSSPEEPQGFTKPQIAVKKPLAKSFPSPTSDQAQNLSQQGPIATKLSPQEPLGTKSQAALKKPPEKSFSSPSSILDATAVAAGARIGSPETAASLLKAARTNKAIRVMTSGGSSTKKTHIPGCTSTQHEARSGMSNASVSTSPRVTSNLHGGSVKPSPPLVKNSSSSASASALPLNSPSQQCNADATGQAAECHPKQDPEAAKETKDSNSIPSTAPKEQVQQNGKRSSTNEPRGEQEVKIQEDITECSNAKTILDNNQMEFTVCTAEEKQNAIDEGITKYTEEPNCESPSVVEAQAGSIKELSKSGVTDASFSK